ncbi:MAG: SBBP repeat-containing protein [Terracidiphilus sp.]
MASKAQMAESYGRIPLSFEANAGQAEKSVKFLSRGKGYGLYLTSDEVVLALHAAGCADSPAHAAQRLSIIRRSDEHKGDRVCARHTDVVSMRLAGARVGAAAPVGEEPLQGTANYFIGSDPAKWHTGVPTYAKVRYSQVYPGVDLVYYGNQRQLEYDFVVAPGASSRLIRLQFAGAMRLRLRADGDLLVTSQGGAMAFHKPVVYQVVDGKRKAVEGSFALMAGHTIGFQLGSYDNRIPLVIDPVMVYSTYLGGSGDEGFTFDGANAVAADREGNAFVTGFTNSIDFPVTSGAFQRTIHAKATCDTAFVTKLDSAGAHLVYSTYLGGSGCGDYAYGVAVDDSGSAYVTGETFSTDFPVTAGAFQKTNHGKLSDVNAFVTKLDPTGSALVYSTYLGGSGGEVAHGIAVDGHGNAYVTGSTFSTDFPVTKGAFQSTNLGAAADASNAFVSKLNADGGALEYSTYLGGNAKVLYYGDSASGIVVNGAGDAYVTGEAYSSNFPVTEGAYQTTNQAVLYNFGTNAFVTKFNSTGDGLVYSTYLGGSGSGYKVGDSATGLAVDGSGNAYITGTATSIDFPVTQEAFQKKSNAPYSGNAFVTKLNSAGSALVYSTYLGGNHSDGANAVAVDATGKAYVTGWATSADFPVTKGAFQTTNYEAINQRFSAFVTMLNGTGSRLVYSTFLGGTYDDPGNGIAVDHAGNVYVAGQASFTDFPTTLGAFQPQNRAGTDGSNAFVAKLDLSANTQVGTTTKLSAGANPAAAGKVVKFTAEITDSIGRPATGGSVGFAIDGKAAGTGKVSAGMATYSTSSLAVGTHTVKASYDDSSSYYSRSSATLRETIELPVASPPIFSPAAGTYAPGQSVMLTDATKGAAIYYTTDGTAPKTTATKYTGAIKLTKTTKIEAIAVATGYTDSIVSSATYRID